MCGKKEEIYPTTCSSHCGSQCFLKVHVRDGVITRVETDDCEDEEMQLRACLKGRAQRQKVYAPDRLKYPMKRVGKRGEGNFERISWNEALDIAASELKRVRKTYGNEAIFFESFGGGNCTFINNEDMCRRLLCLFGGYSGSWAINSREAARYAAAITLGRRYVSNSRTDLFSSRLIILWGFNTATTMVYCNTAYLLARLREKGIRIISVDPRFTRSTAIFADQWIPILPSTDAAMLIAMAYVIVKENLQDQKYLDRYTVGFDQYKEYLMGKEDGVAKTPSWAETITGVAATTIENLAREYATAKPAALIGGIAPGRTSIGGQYHRAAITLAAMTGNIGIHGGNPAAMTLGGDEPFFDTPFESRMWGYSFGSLIPVPPNPVDERASHRKLENIKNYTMFKSMARVHITELPDALLRGRAGGYPNDYKVFWVVNRNPVNQLQYTRKWHEALTSDKVEFVLVHEQFMTATARYADIVLPTTTIFESNDVVASGDGGPKGYRFYGYLRKVIDPVGETKSNNQIARELATRLGISDECINKTDEEHIREFAENVGINYERFREDGIHRIEIDEQYVAFKKQIDDPDRNPFPTPSGRIEIYSEQLAAMNDPNLPPIPKYIEPWEGPNDPLIKKYPLQLITTHFLRRAHSQYDSLAWLRELQTQALDINSVDAIARGIHNGDNVEVFNDRGIVIIPAHVTETIMPGVVDLPQGAWYTPDQKGVDRGGCANTLTSGRRDPFGALVTNTALVQVERVRVRR